MMTDYIALYGLVLAILTFGIALGKFVERIDRFLRANDKEEYIDRKSKNDRRWPLQSLIRQSFLLKIS